MSGICLLLRRCVAYDDSGKITRELDGVEGDGWSWSGRRSARSKYSQLRIFCTTFGGNDGVPGNGARGLVAAMEGNEEWTGAMDEEVTTEGVVIAEV